MPPSLLATALLLQTHDGVSDEEAKARAFQRSPAFAPSRRLRQVAEQRLARRLPLGVRQGRDTGRAKTLFQLLLAATVANLTLAATAVGLLRGRRRRPARNEAPTPATRAVLRALGHLLAAFALARRPQTHRVPAGCRPRF